MQRFFLGLVYMYDKTGLTLNAPAIIMVEG